MLINFFNFRIKSGNIVESLDVVVLKDEVSLFLTILWFPISCQTCQITSKKSQM